MSQRRAEMSQRRAEMSQQRRLGAHRVVRLVRLPREAGTAPVSWLLFNCLHAAGRRNAGAVEPGGDSGQADGAEAEKAASSCGRGGKCSQAFYKTSVLGGEARDQMVFLYIHL